MSASWQLAVALDAAVKRGIEIKLGISLTEKGLESVLMSGGNCGAQILTNSLPTDDK